MIKASDQYSSAHFFCHNIHLYVFPHNLITSSRWTSQSSCSTWYVTSHFVNICMFSVFTCPTYICVPMLVFLKVSESTISMSYISAQGSLCWNWLRITGVGSVNQLEWLAAFPNWRTQAAAGTWELSGRCKVQSPVGPCSSSRPWGWAAAPEFPAQRAPVASTSTCSALGNLHFTKNRAGCAWQGALVMI